MENKNAIEGMKLNNLMIKLETKKKEKKRK